MVELKSFNVELSLSDKVACEEAAKELAIQLKPNWKKEEITFDIFTVGITNKIFAAQVSDHEKLIFRVFGKNTEKVIDRPHELTSWDILAKKGLAAKLYAKFTNGLICGYLPGKSLSVDQVKEPFIRKEICHAMANMHNITIKEGSKPCVVSKTWEFFNNFTQPFADKTQQKRFESHFTRPLDEEISEMIQLVEKAGEDLAFCHNDLLIHNILFDKETKKISFIDYEYADTNYALFDIANHFCEYSGVDNTDYSRCPKAEDKKIFIRDYLVFRFGKANEATLERMLKNTALFEAASHLFWSVWALVQSQNSLIDFDYLGYAIIRHGQFKNRMGKFHQ